MLRGVWGGEKSTQITFGNTGLNSIQCFSLLVGFIRAFMIKNVHSESSRGDDNICSIFKIYSTNEPIF